MKRTFYPDLPLRGERSYVHGTDIYEAIVSGLASCGCQGGAISLSLSIHRFSRHAIELNITDEPTSFPASALTTFRTDAGWLGWTAETERPVTRTVPFREDEITAQAEISGSQAKIAGPIAYPPIDTLVILTKFWHVRSLPPEPGKYWVFVKLELSRLLKAGDSDLLSIQIDQNLANRMTRAMVAVAGEPIGHIYFSKIDIN